jgi:hypothetical protein
LLRRLSWRLRRLPDRRQILIATKAVLLGQNTQRLAGGSHIEYGI